MVVEYLGFGELILNLFRGKFVQGRPLVNRKRRPFNNTGGNNGAESVKYPKFCSRAYVCVGGGGGEGLFGIVYPRVRKQKSVVYRKFRPLSKQNEQTIIHYLSGWCLRNTEYVGGGIIVRIRADSMVKTSAKIRCCGEREMKRRGTKKKKTIRESIT